MMDGKAAAAVSTLDSPPGAAPLALERVDMVFGSAPREVHAVRDASLSVSEGEIVAVVGPSGCGKTTMLSIAGGLLTPTRGAVRILGEDITRLSQARRAGFRLRHVGFVFQSFNLLGALTAEQNVEIVLNVAGIAGGRARERASELIGLLDLAHRAHTRPGALSGGEQQRLAVARALANRPDIILADEPTASLDSAAGHRVMELMAGAVAAREARALVVVTHDVRILDLAHRVVFMEDGRLTNRDPQGPTSDAPGGVK